MINLSTPGDELMKTIKIEHKGITGSVLLITYQGKQ